ncbi:MAG: hypothetical protein H6916_13655 [Novosphingobium sp.]|uniref:hypothetical protein n=1 Tax=Novosphingobium sp. TaxID=1874826 RepID=UPI002606711C|nr:hypothetical protein [Novosphingobium sp.]MCP5387836.1 hypothetical protein [Novosphingobium sp.]
MSVGPKAREYAAWQDGLEDLAIACCAATPDGAGQCLTDFRDLIEGAPARELQNGLLVGGLSNPRNSDPDHVVLNLLGPDCSFMISRGQGGMFISSVCLPGGEEEATASGSSIALATLGALCIALVERAAARQQDFLPGILPSTP